MAPAHDVPSRIGPVEYSGVGCEGGRFLNELMPKGMSGGAVGMGRLAGRKEEQGYRTLVETGRNGPYSIYRSGLVRRSRA